VLFIARTRLVVNVLVALLLATVATMAFSPSAHAQTRNGLAVTSSTIYTPNPEGERLEVASTYTLTNVQGDELIGDSVRSFYFTRWVIAMPANVIDVVATSGSDVLVTTIERDPTSEDVVFGSIALPFNLSYEQSVTVELTYTVPGGQPRAEGAGARVNDSFLSFSVWASGDPGATDVRVNIPDGFAMDLQGDVDDFEQVTRDGETFLEAIDIEEPSDFFGQVFGRNDSGLISETAELPDATATIRAWPDDPEWADFVADAIENDVPVIEDLIGLAWPAGDIEVIETVTPYLYGYGGWFNASSGQIEVGDQLERGLILHELGHAWFNDELIAGRWLTEGLAEEFASQAISASGDELSDPEVPDIDDPLRVPLAAWASPWTLNEEDAYAYELYHYNASWWVMRQITNDVGMDAFSDVLVSLDRDEIPYVGEGPPETMDGVTQWTHFFDLLEIQAGATGLDTLFSDFVLTPTDAARLEPRQAARAQYDELITRSAAWGPPLVVRQHLADWKFDDATATIGIAEQILDRRDDIDALAVELGVSVDHSAEQSFELAESSTDLDAVDQIVSKQYDDLLSLRDARAEVEAMAAELGTRVAFAPMTYDDALNDIADQRSSISALANVRAEVERNADALGIVSAPWHVSNTPTDFESEVALGEARLATLAALTRSARQVDAPRSVTQRLGLLGNDPQPQIDDAFAFYQADDLDQALSAATEADARIANATAAGQTRLIWIGVLAVIVLVIIVGVTRFRRLGSHMPAAGAAPDRRGW